MKISNYKASKIGWAIDYNESKVETGAAVRIGGNIAGNCESLERILNHFAFKRDSPNLKNRFIHLKLSVSPEDSGITSRTFRKIAEKVLMGLGFNNNPFIIYRHFDTEHPHIHIVLSRVTFDGKLVRDSYDGLKIKRLERELDKEFELTPSHGRILSPKEVRMAQKWEKERTEKTGFKSIRNYVQCAIIESLKDQPSLTVFVKRLERRGIKIWHRETTRNSNVYHGLSYALHPELLKINFQEKNRKAVVGGVDESQVDILANKREVIAHAFFGDVPATIITNSNGIPELCLDKTVPEENLKPVSFRALNLGPFFQFGNIINQLSQLENDTLEAITIRPKKKLTKEDYQRKLFTENEGLTSKLIFAAEIKSEERVKEAFSEGINLSQVLELDRACTPVEIEFIKMVMEVGQEQAESADLSDPQKLSSLVLRFRDFTGKDPNEQTIRAIGMIARSEWEQLKQTLEATKEVDDKSNAPDPAIMYLGIPSQLSFTFIEYQQWYSSIGDKEETASAQRKKVKEDTAALLKALQNFDNDKVREIIEKGKPNVSEIPLEHLGKVTDPELSEKLRKLALGKAATRETKKPKSDQSYSQEEQDRQQAKKKDQNLGNSS